MLARFARSAVKLSRRSLAVQKRSMAGAAELESMPAVTGVDLPYLSVTEGKHLGVGDSVPNVLFKTRARIPELVAKGEENPYDWKDTTSMDVFAGKVRVKVK